MNPLDHKLWLGGVSFHAFTFLVLVCVFTFALIKKLDEKVWIPNAMIYATALTTLNIHWYETIHCWFEFVFKGFLTPSIYLMNLPISFLCVYILHRLGKPSVNLLSEFLSVLSIGWFFILGLPS